MSALSQVKPFIIRAPARLHFGFLDLHGGVGRKFGGSGMALAMPALKIRVQPADAFNVRGQVSERIQSFAEHLFSLYKQEPFGGFEVLSIIPEHQGLGSGTQTALAVGHAVARLCGEECSSEAIAMQTGRGKRSGIGVGAFEQGGFLVDGGKKGQELAPIVTRMEVPQQWRVVLITHNQGSDVHGAAEKIGFDNLPDFPEDDAKSLCRILLLGMLPALAQADFDVFASMLTQMQDKVGDYFAAVQGNRYADPKVREVLEYLRNHGIKGIGQSSWGPTGFVLVPDTATGQDVADLIHAQFNQDFGISVSVSQVDNQGGSISNYNT